MFLFFFYKVIKNYFYCYFEQKEKKMKKIAFFDQKHGFPIWEHHFLKT